MRGLNAFRLIILCVSLCPAPALGAAVPSLEEILRRNLAAGNAIHTGRIEYSLETFVSPSTIAGRVDRERAEFEATAGQLRKYAEEQARTLGSKVQIPSLDQRMDRDKQLKLEQLRSTGACEGTFVFDRDRESFYSETRDTRQLDELVRAAGLEDASANLSAVERRSIVGDKDVKYLSGPNMLVTDSNKSAHLDAECFLSMGFLRQDDVRNAAASITAHPEDPNLFSLEIADANRRVELTVGERLGFRVTSAKTFVDGRLCHEERCDYQITGDQFFPKAFEVLEYDQSGAVVASRKYAVTSVELNVPIDSSEFEVEAPEDAGVFDRVNVTMKPGRSGIPPLSPAQKREIVDDLEVPLPREALETQSGGELEKPAVDAGRPAPAENPVDPRAAAKQSFLPLLIIGLGIVTVFVVAPAILLMRRRARRQL